MNEEGRKNEQNIINIINILKTDDLRPKPLLLFLLFLLLFLFFELKDIVFDLTCLEEELIELEQRELDIMPPPHDIICEIRKNTKKVFHF